MIHETCTYIYLPAPSKGWCLNPKGLLSGTPTPIHLAPRKEGPGIHLPIKINQKKVNIPYMDPMRLVEIPFLFFFRPVATTVGICTPHPR